MIEKPKCGEILDRKKLTYNYRFLMVRLHPDKNSSPQASAAACLLNMSILVLRNKAREEDYRINGANPQSVEEKHDCKSYLGAIDYAKKIWSSAVSTERNNDSSKHDSNASLDQQFGELIFSVTGKQSLVQEPDLFDDSHPSNTDFETNSELNTIAAFASIELKPKCQPIALDGNSTTVYYCQTSEPVEIITIESDDETDSGALTSDYCDTQQGSSTLDSEQLETEKHTDDEPDGPDDNCCIMTMHCARHGRECPSSKPWIPRRKVTFLRLSSRFHEFLSKYRMKRVVNHKPRTGSSSMWFLVQWEDGYTGRSWVKDEVLIEALSSHEYIRQYVNSLSCRRYSKLLNDCVQLRTIDGIK